MFYELGQQAALKRVGLDKKANWGAPRAPMPRGGGEPVTATPAPQAAAPAPRAAAPAPRAAAPAPPAPKPKLYGNRTDRGMRNAGLQVPGT